jgi:hypothetical protein
MGSTGDDEPLTAPGRVQGIIKSPTEATSKPAEGLDQPDATATGQATIDPTEAPSKPAEVEEQIGVTLSKQASINPGEGPQRADATISEHAIIGPPQALSKPAELEEQTGVTLSKPAYTDPVEAPSRPAEETPPSNVATTSEQAIVDPAMPTGELSVVWAQVKGYPPWPVRILR